MFIVFGTTGLKHKVSDSPILDNSCPNCDNGNLVNKLYRRWFTLFWIPLIPLDVVDRFYECDGCSSAYSEDIKSILTQSQEKQDAAQIEARFIFGKALIASMTHMAIIDGDFDQQEEREIMDAMEAFEESKSELMEVYEKVKRDKNHDNFVFDLLSTARTQLSSEALINILAQAAVVLLADGKIEKEEENLMKDYLVACGLPKTMYSTLIDKLKTKELAEVGSDQKN